MDADDSQQSRSDINAILRKKRKIREHKACYPCRQRKVRCDSNVPCKTCVDRNHAELCTWNPPDKRASTDSSPKQEQGQDTLISIKKDDWDRVCAKLNDVERFLGELKDDLRIISGGLQATPEIKDSPSSSNPGINGSHHPNAPNYIKSMELNEQSLLTGENVHLGGGSVPALVMALGRGQAHRPEIQEIFRNGTLPLFGLDNESATYPFVSLWGYQSASVRIAEMRKVIPDDTECLENFRRYREGSHISYPVIPSISNFEADMVNFLTNRRLNIDSVQEERSTNSIDGMSIRWIGLLFALFASSIQYSSLVKKERDLLSQVYVCCAFEALRMVNYLSNASLEVVQTLLILGNVLSNANNAGAAWSLLGLTNRLALSLGLHAASAKVNNPSELVNSPSQLANSKTWWSVLWQDSVLSLSYDRASSTACVECPFPPLDTSARGGLSYPECMLRVCKVGLDAVRNRVLVQSIESRLERCEEMRVEVQQAHDQAADHLRDARKCRSTQDQSEHWLLQLHVNYTNSELCRPAISPSIAEFDKSHRLRSRCVVHLVETVEAYIGLAHVAPGMTRSWSVIHRALSAALLLGILGEPLRNERLPGLLSTFIRLMREISRLNDGAELSPPIARSVSALHKLSAIDSRTPRQLEEISGTKPAPEIDPRNLHPDGFPLDFDESAFFLPSPLSGFEDDSSPHALMDSIIWGGGVR